MRYLLPILVSLIAAAAEAQSLGVRAVPTYESVGLYWTDPPLNWSGPRNACHVRYRPVGQAAWKQGHDLWRDLATNECRGSIVHLSPDTEYEAELSVTAGKREIRFRTWSNRVPVASTVRVPNGSATLVINSGGTKSGYVVYQGGVLDAQDKSPYNIYVNASYVVVRGFTLRGASQDAIRLAPDVTDVIIEDNEITGWGRTRGAGLGVDSDSAIRAICRNADARLARITIQRNEIHDPRYDTNSWSDGHPEGPQGITFDNCPGHHVIRHNEIFSTTGRYLNDGIGGSENFSTTGFPNHDTDIYGNEISHVWDDAIEAEGGNKNVRIWGNYMDNTATAVASTVTSVGPLYLFRNVWNRARSLKKARLDDDDRQPMFKAGSHPDFADGRRYIYHNTMLQAPGDGTQFPLGGAMGVAGTGDYQRIRNTVTRNNIFHTWRPYDVDWAPFNDTIQADSGNDFGWDLYNGTAGSTIRSPIIATPTYAPENGWKSEESGMYQLAPNTPGYNQGIRIPNFNDAYLGSAPDVGAQETGTGRMKFGIAASPRSAAGS